MAWGHGELQGEFSAKRGQLFIGPIKPVAADAAFSAQMKAEHRMEQDQNLFGMRSGLRESLIESGAIAAADANNKLHEEVERKAKEQADDILLLALISAGDLGIFLAEEVFGKMSDTEIMAFDAQLREDTGKGVIEHAQDILGEKMLERLPGESDTDYIKRLLPEITKEITDGNKIKPEYQNHPLVKGMLSLEKMREAMPLIEKLNEMVAVGEPVENTHIQEVENKAGDSYVMARTLGRHLDNSDLVGTSRDVQDGSTDVASDVQATDMAGLAGLASLKSSFTPVAAPQTETAAAPVSAPEPPSMG